MDSHTGLKTRKAVLGTPGARGRPEIHRTESRVFMGPRMTGAPLTPRGPPGWTGPRSVFHHPAPFPRKLPRSHPTQSSPGAPLGDHLHTANPQATHPTSLSLTRTPSLPVLLLKNWQNS